MRQKNERTDWTTFRTWTMPFALAALVVVFGNPPTLSAGSLVKNDGASCNLIDGYRFVTVIVSYGDQNDPAYLIFETSTYDPATGTDSGVLGFGFIPNDFVSGSLNHLTLDIDTSLVPDFSAYTFSGYSYIPTNGVVHVEWDQTARSLERGTGTSVAISTYPDGSKVGFHFTGPWERQSAKARGSIFGLEFETEDAQTGSFKENQIEINRNPK